MSGNGSADTALAVAWSPCWGDWAFITARPRWSPALWRNYDELTSRAVSDNRRHGNRRS